MTTVQMDYNNIKQQADVLQTGSDSMKALSTATKAIADGLKATSWFPGIALLIKYFEGISSAADNLSKVMKQLSDGLKKAIEDHKAGDAEIKGYFNLQMA